MFFFPYRADISLGRWPFITLLITLICILTFFSQVQSQQALDQSLQTFCQSKKFDNDFNIALPTLLNSKIQSCEQLFSTIHLHENSAQLIKQLARVAKPIAGLNRE